MDYIKKFESFSNVLNPFDMDDMYNYVEFNHPLYCILSKNRSAKLIMMSPEEYFKIISKGFGMSYEDTISSGAVSKDLYMKYAEDMKKGDKFPLPYYRKDTSLQEGRHRVLACMELGIKEIPVIEFFELTYDEVKEIAYDLKDKTDDQIKSYLESKGFKNFTSLDKRELSNVFKYKF